VRQIRDQCTTRGVAFFFKQWGGSTPKAGGRALDGRTWNQFPNDERLSNRVASFTGESNLVLAR
jgi:protein gp37